MVAGGLGLGDTLLGEVAQCFIGGLVERLAAGLGLGDPVGVALVIDGVRLIAKSGGKSGDWQADSA